MQERHNSIVNALELSLSCTNPSTYQMQIQSNLYKTWSFFSKILNEDIDTMYKISIAQLINIVA